MMARWFGLLALALLAGCAAAGEGEETFVVRNESGATVEVILIVRQVEGDLPILSEDVVLGAGEERPFGVAMRAGAHTVSVTTTNRISERFPMEVPARGDSSFVLVIGPRVATLERTS